MNILFLWTSPFKNAGGVGRVTETLAKEFTKLGHHVTYLSTSQGETVFHENATQYYFPDSIKKKPKSSGLFFNEFLKDHNIDVVINQAGITSIEILEMLDKYGVENLKIYTVHHNCIQCLYDNFEHMIRRGYKDHWAYPIVTNGVVLALLKLRSRQKYRKIINQCIRVSDKFVLLSPQYIPELKAYLKSVPKEGVVGIPNPAPFDAAETSGAKENRLLFVGRTDLQQKRTDLLLNIWGRVQDDFPEWHFDIVGDGPALGFLKEKTKDMKLERVHFHGFSDPKPFLEKAKLFLMTSAYEGFPMVLVEAHAYGVVPIVYDSFNSIRDIIEDQKNGIIVNNLDEDEYVNSLYELMKNEERRKSLKENTYGTVQNFKAPNVATQWDELFQS